MKFPGKETREKAVALLNSDNFLLSEGYQVNDVKTCPHCLAAEETTNHSIGQCPKWSAQRSAVFDSFYLSISRYGDHSAKTRYLHNLLQP